jgi:type IV fimbrial biogenesis protein FimT
MTPRQSNHPNDRQKSAGFTLVEMCAVMAIMAILALMAVPSMAARLDHRRIKTAAETLAGDITEARFEASRRGQSVYVQAGSNTANGQSGWAINIAPDCAFGTQQNCQIHGVTLTGPNSQHPGIQLQGQMALRLDPSGAVQNASGVGITGRTGDQLRVEVSPLGRPRICASAGAWPAMARC